MKKKSLCLVLIYAILLACFNVVFFLNITEPVPQTWISYGFITFAFLMMIMNPLFIGKSKSVYLFTVVNTGISFLYFIATIIVGLIAFIAKTFSIKILLTLFIILTAIYLVILLSMLIVSEKKDNK